MARYEVIARAQVDRRLISTEYIDMALLAHFLDLGMHLQRIDNLPNGQIAVVLQHRLCRTRKQNAAQHKAHHSLTMLGIPAADVQQIDLHRLSRKGRTLVRSWVGQGEPDGPCPAGVREPRKPLPNPPHLMAALDLPAPSRGWMP
jgi:hypothetical protein